jgi:hypothetical protein
MRVLAALCAVIAVALVAAAGDADAAQKRSKVALKPFGSCTELVRHNRHSLLRYIRRREVPPWLGGDDQADEGAGGGGRERAGSLPPPAPQELGESFSGTNVQEAGVDEPDIVKTDGVRLFVVVDETLRAFDLRGAQPIALGTLRLGGPGGELLLFGDRLLVIAASGSRTDVHEVDVRDPSAMRVVRSLSMEGDYVSARAAGGTVRVVVESAPRALSGTARRFRRSVRSATWLPRAVVRRAPGAAPQRRKLVDCRSVRRTATPSGYDVVTVVTLGIADGLQQLDADAVMTTAETIYATPDSLYVAANEWRTGRSGLHRFDLTDPGRSEYVASGSVPGRLVSQWALSEHDGHLRVASTTGWGDGSESRVTVLRQDAGVLAPVGLVTGLGRTEEIRGVRFMGDVGYVVTFRQIDPLYTVDLAEPANPRVLGELKIPGYSTYLHPVGEGLLLGVGQDASSEGETRGTQISLFDVSDLGAPRRLQSIALGRRQWSPVEDDHRAFLFWPHTGLVVLPLERWSSRGEPAWAGAAAFRLAGARLSEIARIVHPRSGSVLRSLVAGGRLLTVSDEGVMSSALADAGDGRWLAYE